MHGRLPLVMSSLVLSAGFLVAGCGSAATSDSAASDSAASDSAASEASAVAGVRVVSAAEGRAIQEDSPAGLVVLDIRTAEEFAEGHLDGATMIDFYAPDFADQIAALDRDAPYLLYCRSGNRSSGARALMEDLGFTNVADIDGGILAWNQADLPIVTP